MIKKWSFSAPKKVGSEEVGLEIRLLGLEHPLKEIGEAAGGMDSTAVAMAIKRLAEQAAKSRQFTSQMRKVSAYCEK